MTDEKTTKTEVRNLDDLTKKYGVVQPRSRDYTNFDSNEKTRLGNVPSVAKGYDSKMQTAQEEMTRIQLELADLAGEYGKLNFRFSDLIKKDGLYTKIDAVKLFLYTISRQKNKKNNVKIAAAGRKGETLEVLVDRMAEVISEQHQNALKGKERSKALQVENLEHMKLLGTSLVERLGASFGTTSDLTEAENSLKGYNTEIDEINGVLNQYETRVQSARASDNIAEVRKLTGEMMDVLDMKHSSLDRQLQSTNVTGEIRRSLMKAAEGVQSAKGALAASNVNYIAINSLIDAMGELEFKYQHAMNDFIPVFKIQGRIGSIGQEAARMREALIRTAETSNKLMASNAKLVEALTRQVFELVKTPLYDVEKAREVEEQITAHMEQLNREKDEWSNQQKRLIETSSNPHYETHK